MQIPLSENYVLEVTPFNSDDTAELCMIRVDNEGRLTDDRMLISPVSTSRLRAIGEALRGAARMIEAIAAVERSDECDDE